MMELQLKHLAGYLPYGLKAIWNTQYNRVHSSAEPFDIVGIQHDTSNLVPCGWAYVRNSPIEPLEIQCIKPMLYPLSSLTKPIKHNVASFIPASMLGHKPIYDAGGILEFGTYIHDLSIENTPYKYIQKLLEWHFDIHGLIDAGLAIDVTTLDKNPY